MKTLFISAGDITWGSSRMRCYWPAKYMDADVVNWSDIQQAGGVSSEYDAYIFQKLAHVGLLKTLIAQGKPVWWDVCDPSWWFNPKDSREITDLMTGVVASNDGLAKDFEAWSGKPCHVIPDRLELAHFPLRREHSDVKPVKLIWFGLDVNRPALFAATANLERLAANGYAFELTIFDNSPEIQITDGSAYPVHYAKWSLETENEVIASHDIALLPPYPGPWGKVKSNNKHLTAWACGIPVMDGQNYEEMANLMERPEKRAIRSFIEMDGIKSFYLAEHSARDWEAILQPQPRQEVFIGRR